MNNFLKVSIWYIISNIILKGIGFLTTPIFSRMLSVEQYGTYGVYTSWESIIFIILTMSMSASIIRGRFDFKNEFNRFISSIIAFNIMVSILVLILNVFIGNNISKSLNIEPWMLTCILLTNCTYHAVNTYTIFERFNGRYKKQVFVSVFVALGTTLLSLLFLVLFDDKLAGRILGYSIVKFLVGLFICASILRKGKPKLKHIKYALPICLPFVPHLLATTVLVSFDRIIISKYCGPIDTALYSLAYTCSMGISVINLSLNEAITPWIGNCLNEKKHLSIYKRIDIYALILFIAYVLYLLIAPELIYILGGEKYMSAIYVIPWVLNSILIQTYTSLYVNIEQFMGKTIGVAIGTCLAALVNIVLNYIFIPKYGYISAAITTFVSYVLLFSIHYRIVRKFGLGKLYNNKLIIILIMCSVILVFPTLLLYNFNLIRWITLFFICIICFIILFKNREKLIEIWRIESE